MDGRPQPATLDDAASEPVHDPGQGRAARWFLALRHGIWRLLPGPLRQRIPHTFIGYCLLNGTTFALDLALLNLLYHHLGLPSPVALTIAYVTALSLAYLLNRWFNFRSHGSLASQSARYVVVVVLNYLLFIIGVGSGLTQLGVPQLVARVIAGACEAIYMYCALRWVVFRDRGPGAHTVPEPVEGGCL